MLNKLTYHDVIIECHCQFAISEVVVKHGCQRSKWFANEIILSCQKKKWDHIKINAQVYKINNIKTIWTHDLLNRKNAFSRSTPHASRYKSGRAMCFASFAKKSLQCSWISRDYFIMIKMKILMDGILYKWSTCWIRRICCVKINKMIK
jgi:hypothetical protein